MLQKRKSRKETLEEVKRKGREERKKREEKMNESDGSDNEEEYYVRQLSAMVCISVCEFKLCLFLIQVKYHQYDSHIDLDRLYPVT